MAATLVSRLGADVGFRRRDDVRGRSIVRALTGASSRAAVASAALVLALLAVAGVATALLLPRSSPAPPQTSLSPASTTAVPARVTHR